MRKHSVKFRRIYEAWARMKCRCAGTSGKNDIKNYLERGISYDPRWSDFKNFMSDMHTGWKSGLSLDRIDNNRNYSKENCRWTDKKTQAINRRSTHFFTYKGESRTLTDWSPIVGVPRSTLAQRFYCLKWPIGKTLSTPLI
jgi:hypothetical protein